MRKKEKVWNSATIKELRARFDISQEVFSKMLGTRQQTVSEWETDEYVPHNAYIRVLDSAEEMLEDTLKNKFNGDVQKMQVYLATKYGGNNPWLNKRRGAKSAVHKE